MPPEAFEDRLHRTVHGHRVVHSNPYTTWFARGEADQAQVVQLTQQFSVFSHLFVEAQLRKVIHSPDVATYHAGKEILLNELGVAFRPPQGSSGLTPEDASLTGTVDGATYRHVSAHFEWLVKFAEPLGLTFQDLGKPRLATAATRRLCDALLDLYGSEDPNVAAGASFAIENWAAAGFWKELITGLQAFKQRSGLPLNLGFWVFHDRLEQQHADHTHEELAELMRTPGFDPEAFLAGAHELLDAVAVFWDGLAEQAGLLRSAALVPAV